MLRSKFSIDVPAALAGYRTLLATVPLGRVRLRWHATAAALVTLSAMLLALAWNNSAGRDVRQARAAQLTAQNDLRVAQTAASRAGIRPDLSLLEPKRLDDVVRDISQFAVQREVAIASLRIDPSAAAGAFSQVQFTVSAKGSYGALKGWLSEILARYPALALKAIALQAPAQGSAQVGATFSLLLFLKPSR